MAQQAIINFNNGEKDWIDPVVNVSENEEFLTIDSGVHTYSFLKAGIKSVEYIEIDARGNPIKSEESDGK
jgi:hypothetical protein